MDYDNSFGILLDTFFDAFWIKAEIISYVGEYNFRASMQDRGRCSEEGIGRHDYRVTLYV